MAYSMNWRPQLDEIAQTTSTMPAGPAPGVLPPGRKPVATGSTSISKPALNGGYSYNVNWRPPSPTAVRQSDNEQARTRPDQPRTTETSKKAGKSSSFRASLADGCPSVSCIGYSAFSCTIDGLVVTLEWDPEDASWNMRSHPVNEALSTYQILDLARCMYACLYAALCQIQAESLVLQQPTGMSPAHSAALDLLSIPMGTFTSTVEAAFLMENFALADRRYWRTPRPISRRDIAGQRSNGVPLTPVSEDVYSRYSAELDAFVGLAISNDPIGDLKGSVAAGTCNLRFDIHNEHDARLHLSKKG